jgi:hypothetical protein
MDTLTITAAALLAVLVVLYAMKRRSRVASTKH